MNLEFQIVDFLKKKLKELIGDDDVMTSHYSNCVENTSLGTDTL